MSMNMNYISWAGYDLTCCGEDATTGSGCTIVIWNGTGILDSGGDWDHNGHGFEVDYAKYEGTNGLDATGFTNNKKIFFQDANYNNIDEYNILSMYIDLKEYPTDGDFYAYFGTGNQVNLKNYLNTENLNTWQRLSVPLEDFGLSVPINLKKLTIESAATMGFYLDNVEFLVGAISLQVIDVNKPDMEADLTNTPSMKSTQVDFRPNMRAFSPPLNL